MNEEVRTGCKRGALRLPKQGVRHHDWSDGQSGSPPATLTASSSSFWPAWPNPCGDGSPYRGLVLWQCPDQLTGGNWTLARSMIDQLLFRLPDLPKWVGLRSMLPERKCEVLEFRSEPLRAIVRSTQLPLSCIVGNPAGCELESLVSALAGEADILAEPGNSPELRPALAGLGARGGCAACLESRHGASHQPVSETHDGFGRDCHGRGFRIAPKRVATGAGESICCCHFCSGQSSVSFCYPWAVTESLGDVSIKDSPRLAAKGPRRSLCRVHDRIDEKMRKEPCLGQLCVQSTVSEDGCSIGLYRD